MESLPKPAGRESHFSQRPDLDAWDGWLCQAVDLYRLHRPDWILMDQEMPRTDGITAIREIIAEFPEANICMVTAFDDEHLRSEALTAGASGFVLKDNLFELETILGQ